MSGWTALKKTYSMCRRLCDARGGALPVYLADAVYCGFRHGASPENYFVLRFYELSDRQRETFLTSGRSKECDRKLNAGASEDDRRALACKNEFNNVFAGLVKRESVYAPDSGFAAFAGFLERHDEFMLKPVRGTMGRGIEKLRTEQLGSVEDFYRSCRENRILVEEVICQHPVLSALNADSVNSVRINAARDRDGQTVLIGACLKCGGRGACTDNFHSGGVAYPIDMDTGRISGSGRNNTDIRDFIYHPGSGVRMPGLMVPYWTEITHCVRQAMERVPTVGYAGWDIAVTPDGPELIEGNYSWPGGNIIQFDGVGKYTLLKKCLGEDHEQHTHR